MIPNNRWVAVSAILAGIAGLCVLSVLTAGVLGRQGLIAPFWTGYGIAAALAVPSYLSLVWSLRRSTRIFYGVFIGGMFFRLVSLASTAFIVYRFYRWALAAVLLPLVFGLILSSFIEMYFIQKEARV